MHVIELGMLLIKPVLIKMETVKLMLVKAKTLNILSLYLKVVPIAVKISA